MEINATFDADLVGLKMKHDEYTGARTCTVEVVGTFGEDDLRNTFGAKLAALAFASMEIDDSGRARFGFREMKPTTICSKHTARMCAEELDTVPEIKKLAPAGGGKQEVSVTIAMPVLITSQKMIGDIAMRFGEGIEIELQARQLPLPIGDDVDSSAN